MLKILCQFASERKSVHAEFFFTELAFVLAKFSLLRLNKKQKTFRTFLSSKKLMMNNWVILAVQRQIISQKLVLKIIFQKKHFLYLLYSATQKNFPFGCFFWYECDMILTWINRNWISSGNVKLQSAASKRYSYPLSMHHPSNINWTILLTVRLMETLGEM